MILSNYKILNRHEVRELDRRAIQEYGIPGIILMENAGRSVAEYIISYSKSDPVVIVCGKGNNGGDGFVIARHLDNHNIPVRVILCCDPQALKEDALLQFNIIKKSNLSILEYKNQTDFATQLKGAGWIVDALFGTGLQGSVHSPFDSIIEIINHTNATILAVDIPSGLECDTGKPQGVTIKADHTVTFAALKRGFITPDAAPYIGKVSVVDIGIPRILFCKRSHSN